MLAVAAGVLIGVIVWFVVMKGGAVQSCKLPDYQNPIGITSRIYLAKYLFKKGIRKMKGLWEIIQVADKQGQIN